MLALVSLVGCQHESRGKVSQYILTWNPSVLGNLNTPISANTQISHQSGLESLHDSNSASLGPPVRNMFLHVASQVSSGELDNFKQSINSTYSNKIADEVSCICVESRGDLGAYTLFVVAQMNVRHCQSLAEAQVSQTRGMTQT